MLRDDIRLDILLDTLTSLVGPKTVARTDAQFNEADHPRDADGKFTKGSYLATLKPGTKGSAAGLIKHLLLGGKHSVDDIFKLAQKHYGVGSSKLSGKAYVQYYANQLKKAGEKIPELPGESAKEAPAVSSPAKTPLQEALSSGKFPGPASMEQLGALEVATNPKLELDDKIYELESLAGKVTTDGDADYIQQLKEFLQGKPDAPQASPKPPVGTPQAILAKGAVTSKAKEPLEALATHWDKILPANKAQVAEGLKQLEEALGTNSSYSAVSSKLSEIQPLTGGGQAKESFNQALKEIQGAFGVTSTKTPPKVPTYTPTTSVQKAVYARAKILPHFKVETVSHLEDAKGQTVRSRLKVDTKKIPEDFFAEVTSSYGDDPQAGTREDVNRAMGKYRNHISQKLTADQASSMSYYKGSGYEPINDALLGRNKFPTDATKKKIEIIRQVTRAHVIPADTPVFRGMKCSLERLSGFKDAEHSVGRCFEHKNFASCSRNIKVSESFGSDVMLSFTVKAGTPGYVLGAQGPGDGGGESELVLPDRGVFRIDKVEERPHPFDKTRKSHLVHVTYLGDREENDDG